MKRQVFAILLAGVLGAGLLAGCGGSASSSSNSSDSKSASSSSASAVSSGSGNNSDGKSVSDVMIGISVPKAVTGWTAAVSYYSEKYCKENNINYKLVQAESTNDQANQLDDLISMKPDAIVLNPINDELATAAQTVMDAGIPLINYDRTLGDTKPDYYYAGDNPGCGSKGADWIAETLGKDDAMNVVTISITSWGNIAQERLDGFKEELPKACPKAKIIGEYASESASQEDGLKVMADVLQSNPDIDVVFLVDDEQACGALQAIDEAGRTDIKALYAAGGGSTNFLNKMPDSSFPVATVSYHPSMIVKAIQEAVDVATGNGSKWKKETIEDPVVITKDNMEQWKKDIGYDPNSPY